MRTQCTARRAQCLLLTEWVFARAVGLLVPLMRRSETLPSARERVFASAWIHCCSKRQSDTCRQWAACLFPAVTAWDELSCTETVSSHADVRSTQAAERAALLPAYAVGALGGSWSFATLLIALKQLWKDAVLLCAS